MPAVFTVAMENVMGTLNRTELDSLERRELQLTILAAAFVLVQAAGLVTNVVGAAVQTPATQVDVMPHALPHMPQLTSSVVTVGLREYAWPPNVWAAGRTPGVTPSAWPLTMLKADDVADVVLS